MKKIIYSLIVATFLILGVSNAYAGNIKFNVTVGGNGSQDPLSKRETKTADKDNYAYYRATNVSSSNNDRAYVMVESINLYNQNIITPQLTQLCSVNIGRTLKREYNVVAPKKEYYFMKASTEGPRINVVGYYCP